MGVKLTLDTAALNALWEVAKRAALQTAEVIHGDLVSSQTMPFNTGTMQNSQTFSDSREEGEAFIASVITDSPQARRLHFHPEYNFQKANNPNAGGEWLMPYLTGEKRDLAEKTFAEVMKKEVGS